MTENEMVHQPDGHGYEQALGVGDGQGSLGQTHTYFMEAQNKHAGSCCCCC